MIGKHEFDVWQCFDANHRCLSDRLLFILTTICLRYLSCLLFRFTVLVVELASTASLMNSHSSGALCVTCFMTLVTLLGLVRKFARRRGVMSDTHRARALDIVCAIEDHLKLRFVGLKHPKDETSKPDSEASITTGKNIDAVNTE